MIDDTTEATDKNIAMHILRVHRRQLDQYGDAKYTMEQMQRYIKYARCIRPQLTTEVRGGRGQGLGLKGFQSRPTRVMGQAQRCFKYARCTRPQLVPAAGLL